MDKTIDKPLKWEKWNKGSMIEFSLIYTLILISKDVYGDKDPNIRKGSMRYEKVILRKRSLHIFDMKMKWEILGAENGDQHRIEAWGKGREVEKMDKHKKYIWKLYSAPN